MASVLTIGRLAQAAGVPARTGQGVLRPSLPLYLQQFLAASLTSGALIAIQTGVLVFLFPLYLVEQGHLRPETVGYLISLGVLRDRGGPVPLEEITVISQAAPPSRRAGRRGRRGRSA